MDAFELTALEGGRKPMLHQPGHQPRTGPHEGIANDATRNNCHQPAPNIDQQCENLKYDSAKSSDKVPAVGLRTIGRIDNQTGRMGVVGN